MLCVAAGALSLALAASEFTLDWTHSVERISWWEQWQISPAGLRPIRARIKGSGAGMEPPEGAIFTDGGWEYSPDIPPQQRVVLASAGAGQGGAAAGWHLCAGGQCYELGADGSTLTLWQAPQCP